MKSGLRFVTMVSAFALLAGPALAIDVNLGGLGNASVGTSNGVSVNANVGGSNGVNANAQIGGSGSNAASVNATLDGSGGAGDGGLLGGNLGDTTASINLNSDNTGIGADLAGVGGANNVDVGLGGILGLLSPIDGGTGGGGGGGGGGGDIPGGDDDIPGGFANGGSPSGDFAGLFASLQPNQQMQIVNRCKQVMANPANYRPDAVALCKLVLQL